MRTILVTGSADGLGLIAARQLIAAGHQVTLHARDAVRAEQAMAAAPAAAGVLTADLASLEQTRMLAEAAVAAEGYDAVIHNAGIGYREVRRTPTEDGLERVFQVNVLAPYLLTALMPRPERLVYLSSGLHRSGELAFDDLQWESRGWNAMQAYSDSKLHDAILAAAVARAWPDVRSNAVEPGWIATRMGGDGGSQDFEAGADTQTWLASSDDPGAEVSGAYLYHRERAATHPAVGDPQVQDELLAACRELTGTGLHV